MIDDVELPTLTLCFGLAESFKWETLTAEDKRNILGKDSINETEWNLMVAEQHSIPPFARSYNPFRNTLVKKRFKTTHPIGKTLSLQDIVSELEFLEKIVNTTCATGHRKETTRNLPSFISVETSFDYFSKCFTVAFNRDYRTFDLSSLSGKRFIELLTFPYPAVNHKLRFLELYFQYGNQKLNSIHEPLIIDLSETGRLHKLSFEPYFFNALPPPYETQCKDYGEDVSQQECYEQCLSSQTLRSFGKFPSKDYVTESDNFDFVTDAEEEGMIVSNTSQKFKDKNVCKSKCSKRECKLAMLLPVFLSSTKKFSNSTSIAIEMSNAPGKRVVSQPSMPLIPFITTVSVLTLGFWLVIFVFPPSCVRRCEKDSYFFLKRTDSQRSHSTRQKLLCPFP